MKTEVFIPTHPPNFKYLDDIVQIYLKSSVIPDIITISASNYQDKHKDLMDAIIDKYEGSSNCSIIINRINQKVLVAENRRLSKNSDADLIVYHDSDDYPHLKRIEIIKKILPRL